MVGSLVLLFAVTVKLDRAQLRAACDESEPVIAKLPQGTPVEIRFALSDGSGCYKVSATVDGKQQVGYLAASQLAGLEGFEQQLRGAPATGASTASSSAAPQPLPRTSDPLLGAIIDLLNANQPASALEHMEPLLKLNPRNANLLALAAVAAYRTDDVRHALEYGKQCLALQPDDQIAAMVHKMEHESSVDKSGEKLYGMRVALRYEGASLPAETARAMVAVLDEEFAKVSSRLGCATEERITAIVQSPEAYFQTTGAAEWSGGLYDGRIHVPALDGEAVTPRTRRTLAHEIVHACLANIGRFPVWLHEGLAQKLSCDSLSSAARLELRQQIQAGAVPKLENITPDWSRMESGRARLAYSLALAAADVMVDQYANFGLRNIVHNREMLRQITPGIDRALGL